MPSLSTYGLKVSLYSQKPQLRPSDHSAFVPIQDGCPSVKWMTGMNHPVFVSAVESPARPSAKTLSPTPFKVAVSLDQEDLPDYMKGDVRVELVIDGLVCGLKIFSEAKLKGKIYHEFTGLRNGRTEERPFVFNCLPRGTKDVDNFTASSLSDLGETFCQSTILDHEGKASVDEPSLDSSLVPFAPAELPPNTSHIQVLVTLGSKFRTLEKYLVDSAVQQSAFYIKPNSAKSFKIEEWNKARVAPNNDRNNKKTALLYPRRAPKPTSTLGLVSDSAVDEPEDDTVHDSVKVNKKERNAGWKPIGFGYIPQKTVQTKEVEFVARMHLVRLWIFVVPSSNLIFPSAIVKSPNVKLPLLQTDDANFGSLKPSPRKTKMVILKFRGAGLSYGGKNFGTCKNMESSDALPKGYRNSGLQPERPRTPLSTTEISRNIDTNVLSAVGADHPSVKACDKGSLDQLNTTYLLSKDVPSSSIPRIKSSIRKLTSDTKYVGPDGTASRKLSNKTTVLSDPGICSSRKRTLSSGTPYEKGGSGVKRIKREDSCS